MPSSLAPLLIVAFVCLFLGGIGGLLIASLRGAQEEPSQPGEETPPGGRPGRYQAVMRLWHEKASETVVVELDGKAYLTPEPLSLAQREKLERALAELSGWLGVRLAGGSTPTQTAPAPVATPVVVQPVEKPAPAPQPVSMPPPAAPPQSSSSSTTPPPPLPLPLVGGAQPVKEEPRSIVGQIDAILQEKLVAAGLANRGIGLSEDPRRGVIVTVGLQRFEGIDAVTDLEIQKIIRSAVAEWERRQEPSKR